MIILQAGCPSCCPTNSIKALKAYSKDYNIIYFAHRVQEKMQTNEHMYYYYYYYTHVTASFPGQLGWAGARKMEPVLT